MKKQNKLLWILWSIFALSLIAGLTYLLLDKGASKDFFLPGETTHGHFQIEMNCSACHTPMMGVKTNSCLECHKEELDRIEDSHPAKKFNDPRNADRLEKIDAQNCITCHIEHNPDITHPMGVTIPIDYCFHCHEDIAEERPSHEGMPFNTCATAGCHNYHDNKALYEDFLLKHNKGPKNHPESKVPPRQIELWLHSLGNSSSAMYDTYELGKEYEWKKADLSVPVDLKNDSITKQFTGTIHEKLGVSCMDCHQGPDKSVTRVPTHENCSSCHENEVKGFLESRHGMRLKSDLSPMTPGMARIPMHENAAHKSMSCNACHSSHTFDTKVAAKESCTKCHNDEHTMNFEQSPHGKLWAKALKGEIPEGKAVSCATCHLPRVESGNNIFMVDHNQNNSLRPNEKMVRSVCMNCHGLQFTLNALADTALIKSNFTGMPNEFIESIDMVIKRNKDSQPTHNQGE